MLYVYMDTYISSAFHPCQSAVVRVLECWCGVRVVDVENIHVSMNAKHSSKRRGSIHNDQN